MSRTYTYGVVGTSHSQFMRNLRSVHLAREGAHWRGIDVEWLLKPAYDQIFARALGAAPAVSIAQAKAGQGGQPGDDVRVVYRSPKDLVGLCRQLMLMTDLKAGVPRTAYAGVIPLRIHGRRVLIAPGYRVDQDVTKNWNKKLKTLR